MAKRIRLTKHQCEQLARSILHDLHDRFETKRNEVRQQAEKAWRKSKDGRLATSLARRYPDSLSYAVNNLAAEQGRHALKHWTNPIKLRSNDVNRLAGKVALLAVEMDSLDDIATTIRKAELRQVSKRQRRKFGVPIA